MAITFDGASLFASGPHRVSYGVRGQETQPLWRILDSNSAPGNTAIGDEEIEITVTGRLVAGSESDLWTLRQAVVSATEFDDGTATLVDHNGRSWLKMRLLAYTEGDRVDRGRDWSIGYTAVFARLFGDGP